MVINQMCHKSHLVFKNILFLIKPYKILMLKREKAHIE